MGSLTMESSLKEFLINQNIDVMDMECSAFFHAAHYTKKKAMALFYASDILEKKPLFEKNTQEEKFSINEAIKNACKNITQI